MYILLLKLEDRSNPLAIIAECQRDQQQREQRQQQLELEEETEKIFSKDPIKLKQELTLSIFSSLNQFIKHEKFTSLLSIRKGKVSMHQSIVDQNFHKHTIISTLSSRMKAQTSDNFHLCLNTNINHAEKHSNEHYRMSLCYFL